ncbi:MAG: ATP synthase F0 subunit B [Defluviitaleaceae bacterium]|nr:ATP synthase F0 subunit B [Defluviitaleaceae bacterium]
MNQGFIFLLNAEPTPRLFDLDLQTFLQMAPALVNFIGLAVILTFILYKPVRAFLHERAERIARELDDAEAVKQAALALKEQYEQLLKGIELERTAILDDARKQAAERRNRDMAETKKEIEDLKSRAGVEIAAELDRVKDMVEQAIVEISSEMAGKLLSVTIDPSIHNRLFDEAMAELEATVFK